MYRRVRCIAVLLAMIMLFSAGTCFAGETEESVTTGNRFAIPMSVVIGFSVTDSSEGIVLGSCRVNADTDDVDTFVFRIVLEKYSSSGYQVVKTWRDINEPVDSVGEAMVWRYYQLTESGTYRIRTSGVGYLNGSQVVSFSDLVSSTASW